MRHVLARQDGQGLVEYGLILFLVSIVADVRYDNLMLAQR
jgi:hypothetical protein